MRDVLLATLILIGVALLLLAIAGLFFAWKVLRSDERKLARRIGKLPFRDKLRLGRDLFADPGVPVVARFVAIALVVYLTSPIDLIPDFIPVVGLVDDLLVVMIGAGLLLRLVGPNIIEEHVRAFEERREKALSPPEATTGR